MRLFWHVLTMELRRSLAYRVEFWLRFAGLLFANVSIAYFLWKAIFAQAEGGLAALGYTFHGMILYYVLVPLIENITRPVDGRFIATEIYSGTLTRYLIYPMAFFPYKYATTLATSGLAGAQLLLVLLVAAAGAWVPPEMHVTATSIAMAVGACAAAGLLNFALVSLVEMAAFWADSVWSLNVMVSFCARLLGGALLPLALFPASVQEALGYTPFPYLVSFPVLTLLGRVDAAGWLRGLGATASWTALFALLGAVVWRRGCRQYTGVGI